jgi:hypothetical protein
MKLAQLTIGKLIVGTTGLLLVTSGAAYAAGTITGADILDGTVASVDIKDDNLSSADIRGETLKSVDILDGQVKSADIRDGDVTSADVKDGTIQDLDLGADSVSSAEVLDFGLSNQDVGVLFAQVEESGTLANSSGGVTSTNNSLGVYEVDFNRDVSGCAFLATHGLAGVLGEAPAPRVITVRDGLSASDTVLVEIAGLNGSPANGPFNLVVVC